MNEMQAVKDIGIAGERNRGGIYAWFVVGVLAAGYAIAVLDRFLLSVILVPLKTALLLSDTQLGLLSGLSFALLYCLVTIPLGWVTDVVNRCRLIAFGMLIWSAATAASAFADSFSMLFAARIVIGLGEAVLVPASISLIVAYVDRAQLGRATGIFIMGSQGGYMLAFVVGGALLSYLTTRGGLEFIRHFAPWQAMFLIASIPGIIIAALILNLQEPARPAHFKVDLGIADAWRHVKQAGAAYGFHFCYGSSVYLLGTVFAAWAPSFYVREFKVDNSLAALLSGAAALSGGPLGSWVGGTIMDRLLKRGFFAAPAIVIMLGLSLFLPGCILFILSKNLTLSVIGYALAQFCILMGAPPAYAGVQMLTPERHRGLLAAVFHTICTLAALGGGVTVVGIVNDQFFAGGELGVSILIVALSFAGFGVLLATLGRSAFKRAASRIAASMPV